MATGGVKAMVWFSRRSDTGSIRPNIKNSCEVFFDGGLWMLQNTELGLRGGLAECQHDRNSAPEPFGEVQLLPGVSSCMRNTQRKRSAGLGLHLTPKPSEEKTGATDLLLGSLEHLDLH